MTMLDDQRFDARPRVIRLVDEDDFQFWLREFGVSDAELVFAVRLVGTSARLVEAYLNNPRR